MDFLVVVAFLLVELVLLVEALVDVVLEVELFAAVGEVAASSSMERPLGAFAGFSEEFEAEVVVLEESELVEVEFVADCEDVPEDDGEDAAGEAEELV